MLNSIGENEIRGSSRTEPATVAADETRTQKQAEEVRQSRPVEKSEAGQKSKTDDKKKESSKYKLEETKIIFEKYNKNGDLIIRIPPSHKSVDQKA